MRLITTKDTHRRAQRRSRARARLDWHLFCKGYKRLTTIRLQAIRQILSTHHSRDPAFLHRIAAVEMATVEKDPWRCGWCWRLCKHSHQRCPDCGSWWTERDQTFVHQPRGTGKSPRRRTSGWTNNQEDQWEDEWNGWNGDWETQPPHRPASPRRSHSKGRKGKGMTKHKGKGKGKASQGSAEPQYGPAALGIALPDPPWKPTLTALPAASGSAGTISDAQIRGLLNDMKKVPDLPADARTILQRYQKRQGQRTTKTMHQAVTDLGKAREALDQAHLARHQLHGSWRHFLNEALTTWQTYTEGFKQQEADLVARIEEAKQCLHSAKEVFEECRNALTDLNQTDQRLVEDAEAVMTVDAEDEREDPAVQQDLESMRGHLATLKQSAEVAAAAAENSAKRPRLEEAVPPAPAATPGSGALEPFGGARK